MRGKNRQCTEGKTEIKKISLAILLKTLGLQETSSVFIWNTMIQFFLMGVVAGAISSFFSSASPTTEIFELALNFL